MSINDYETKNFRDTVAQESVTHLRRDGIEPGRYSPGLSDPALTYEADLIAERADHIMEDHAELADFLEDCLPRPIAEFLAHAAIHWSPEMGGEWAYYGHKSDELLRELVHAWCKQEAGI